MVNTCSAVGCTNRRKKDSKVKFHRFPADTDRRKRWIQAMRRMKLDDPAKPWEPKNHDRLCSEHFIGGCPSDDRDHPDFIPSVFSFTPLRKTTNVNQRYERRLQRRRALIEINTNTQSQVVNNRRMAVDALLELGVSGSYIDKGTCTEPDPVDTELTSLKKECSELESKYAALQSEYQQLLSEVYELRKEQENMKFTYPNLKSNEIRTLTGLPSYSVFVWLLTLVTMCIKPVGKMCQGDQLLLVLMKLKLNLTNADLAIRFNICPTQVSRIFSTCVPVIAKKVKFLIRWPDKGTILKNMPRSFRPKYKNCRVIIDCTEIFIQRPSNLDTRAKTYSNYKHHNTMKFLVGITPYGAISFLFECWGGRVSDKELTNKSGFYNKLEFGDLVLADRGFLISEELAVHGATLAIPPFTKGKKQLSQREVECARQLSRSRIHVERAIERIKNFQILKHTMPISLVSHADNILTICGALTNLLPKLVK